jgi:hypothetical protein
MRVDVDVALDALLPHVSPAVSAHPLALALGALVLAETPLLALVRGQTFTLGAGLQDKYSSIRIFQQNQNHISLMVSPS